MAKNKKYFFELTYSKMVVIVVATTRDEALSISQNTGYMESSPKIECIKSVEEALIVKKL